MSDAITILNSEDHIHSTLSTLNSAGISLSAGSLLRPLIESISFSSAISFSPHNKLLMCLSSLLGFACLSSQDHEFLDSKECVLFRSVFLVKLIMFVE